MYAGAHAEKKEKGGGDGAEEKTLRRNNTSFHFTMKSKIHLEGGKEGGDSGEKIWERGGGRRKR